MASIRELRSRIRSVQSTKKITKAQELIATSRITKAQARVAAAKPYAEEMTTVLSELASNAGTLDNPLLTERENPKRAAILVVTSDRGMCGGYNANVLKATRELISLLREEGKEAVLFVMGRKGVGFFNFRGQEIADSWTGFSEAPKYTDASTATEFLVNLFVAGSGTEVERPGGDGTLEGVDELHLVYTRFQSMLSQVPEVRRVAPLVVSEDDSEDEKPSRNYTFEPNADTLLDALLPKYVATRVYAALLDSAASESAARRTAMKAATDNAEELAKTLSREANQLRQAQITQEISEIVGGSSALAN
ncbi:F0F1 ATP synthase subunit gamma [Gordonia paraffinivorans]|uniref:ATP synthase gamma chain n=2 Tax=Gordonia paraffinivorans TaxID=175628 RepID=A0ABQ0ING9_9ACTN|nr:F0F1 ATP synthase subunit gamma [Gordonia paraffinivorans]MBY4574334.1 F0F1 ATP synthase subunit gamma [Gordonia paraffinivorans]MCD2147426.1 F0F1 ATP synthase subunit gamma [Gordonia paraffinivorans]PWD42668.1 F0F1 ATP synthase subunit gamma [Gordonia paraffinivorans]VFA90531.1 F-ATPase gamma subunit [Gordonia paraffinivorans]GAC85099.1 ATP synthase gamma chain [Gordonia paraffinivorans NBRC 108238]